MQTLGLQVSRHSHPDRSSERGFWTAPETRGYAEGKGGIRTRSVLPSAPCNHPRTYQKGTTRCQSS